MLVRDRLLYSNLRISSSENNDVLYAVLIEDIVRCFAVLPKMLITQRGLSGSVKYTQESEARSIPRIHNAANRQKGLY